MGEQVHGQGVPQQGPDVTITIDGTERKIHRGHQTVAAIKAAGQVPAAMELEEVIDGKLHPLADDGAVILKGSEVFISHVRDSASS